MPSDRLEIDRCGIAKFIADGGLTVPPHQREYAWREQHVRDLYQDIADHIGEPDYFIGSIVVSSKSGKLEIFDGQQRLATIVILLAAIRNWHEDNNDSERAQIIHSKYLIDSDLETLAPNPRLILSRKDNDFFQKKILSLDKKDRTAEKPTSPSHHRLVAAEKEAKNHIQKLVSSITQNKEKVLTKLVGYLRDRVMVVCVKVPDDVNAYTIFETMNDRGLAPSAADLIKNHIFGVSGETDRLAEAQYNWDSMLGILDAIPDTRDDVYLTYIRHAWISCHGPTRTRQLYAKIKTEIKNSQSAINITSSFAKDSILYSAILNPSNRLWRKYGGDAPTHIDTLSTLNMEQIRPLLLSGLKVLKPTEIAKLLYMATCWAVRSMVVGTAGSGTLESAYGKCAQSVFQGQFKTAKQIATFMASNLPNDKVFRENFATARVLKSHIARYYLRTLQAVEDGDRGLEYLVNLGSYVNLEHILPKTPSPDWNITQEDLKEYINRIGNLAIMKTSDNDLAENSAFDVKKPLLAKSTFSLTKSCANYTSWGPDQINKRQSELAKLAVIAWPIKF